MTRIIRPFDREAIRAEYLSGKPFPFFKIDGFLEPAFLEQVVSSYPVYDTAKRIGREFESVNEKLKVQITDRDKFPEPVKQLTDVLEGNDFLADLEYITGIPMLLADPQLRGGGMHLTNSSGRLDVHVDFNIQDGDQLFRRLNILLYLNPVWEESWGGNIEFWDKDVTKCCHSFMPLLNRCVVFETSETSFHGVTPITCPKDVTRKSFASYYYTKAAPSSWSGESHSTIFKARPDEKLRGHVLMPAERVQRRAREVVTTAKNSIKRLLGR